MKKNGVGHIGTQSKISQEVTVYAAVKVLILFCFLNNFRRHKRVLSNIFRSSSKRRAYVHKFTIQNI